MRRNVLALATVAVLAASLGAFTPMASWARPSDRASPAVFCVKAAAWVLPHHAHVGDDMDMGAGLKGCSRQGAYVRYTFLWTGPCGLRHREHGHIRFFYGFSLDYFLKVPCKGTYRVEAKVWHHGQLVDHMTRRVHVRS